MFRSAGLLRDGGISRPIALHLPALLVGGLMAVTCVIAAPDAAGLPEFDPLAPTANDPITVFADRPAKLHWGVDGWRLPPEEYRPPGTVPWQDGRAVESPMGRDSTTGRYSIVLGPFKSPLHAVSRLDFVLHFEDGSWGRDRIVVIGQVDPPPTPPGPVPVVPGRPLVGYQVSRKSGGDRLAALETAKREGADLLEILLDKEKPDSIGPEEAARIASRARELGIPLQVHSSIGTDDNLGRPPLVPVMRLAKALGAEVITVHLDDLAASSEQPDWRLATSLGLTVAVENHSKLGPDLTPLVRYLSRLPKDAPVGMTLDLGHANIGGAGAVDYVRRLLPELARLERSIANVHIHDNKGDKDSHMVIGEGSIDFATLLPMLAQAGCRRLVIERWDRKDVCLKRARAWLGGTGTR